MARVRRAAPAILPAWRRSWPRPPRALTDGPSSERRCARGARLAAAARDAGTRRAAPAPGRGAARAARSTPRGRRGPGPRARRAAHPRRPGRRGRCARRRRHPLAGASRRSACCRARARGRGDWPRRCAATPASPTSSATPRCGCRRPGRLPRPSARQPPYTWAFPSVRAGQALAAAGGGSLRVVAVIDTGVDVGHPDLAGRVVPASTRRPGRTDVTDLNGHGTFVAG